MALRRVVGQSVSGLDDHMIAHIPEWYIMSCVGSCTGGVLHCHGSSLRVYILPTTLSYLSIVQCYLLALYYVSDINEVLSSCTYVLHFRKGSGS